MILLGIWNNIIDFPIVKRDTFLVNLADSIIVCYANFSRKTLFLFLTSTYKRGILMAG
jgi:hypothetical protein